VSLLVVVVAVAVVRMLHYALENTIMWESYELREDEKMHTSTEHKKATQPKQPWYCRLLHKTLGQKWSGFIPQLPSQQCPLICLTLPAKILVDS